MPRFRIKSLLIFTAFVGLGVFIWMQFVASRVAGVSIRNSRLLVFFNRSPRRLADPYDIESFRPGGAPFFWPWDDINDLFIHAYDVVEIPIITIAIAAIGLFAFVAGIIAVVRALRRRPKPNPSSANDSAA
jgi:hypothetical protein